MRPHIIAVIVTLGVLVCAAPANASPRSHDDDSSAEPIALNSQAANQDNTTATEETGEDLFCDTDDAPLGMTLWYSIDVPERGTLTITVTGDSDNPDTPPVNFDSVAQLYLGDEGDPRACNDDFDTSNPGHSRIQIKLDPGQYFLQVGGYDYGAGDGGVDYSDNFTVTVDFEPEPPPPAPTCSDGRDNDADGKTDYPGDPGCTSGNDDNEADPPPPIQPPPPINLDALIEGAFSYRTRGGRLIIDFIRLRRVPAGARIRARCFTPRRRSCGGQLIRRATASDRPRAHAAKTVLLRRLAGKRLRRGSRILVQITAPGAIGKWIRWTVKRRRGSLRAVRTGEGCTNRNQTRPLRRSGRCR